MALGITNSTSFLTLAAFICLTKLRTSSAPIESSMSYYGRYVTDSTNCSLRIEYLFLFKVRISRAGPSCPGDLFYLPGIPYVSRNTYNGRHRPLIGEKKNHSYCVIAYTVHTIYIYIRVYMNLLIRARNVGTNAYVQFVVYAL